MKDHKFIVGSFTVIALLFCIGTARAVDYSAESDEVIVPITDLGAPAPPPTPPPAPPAPPPIRRAPRETPPPENANLPAEGEGANENANQNANNPAPEQGLGAGQANFPPAPTSVKEVLVGVNLALTGFADTARKRVFENQQVKTAVNTVVAPATTAVTVTAVATINFTFIFQYLVFLLSQPIALLDRRRAKRWGTVYNALSKMPVDLATVRLLDATGRLVRTRVTDGRGRYLFIAPAGTYALEAVKAGFAFPAPSIGQKQVDADYADLYNGGPITVADQAVSYNIPIEPADGKESAKALLRKQAGLAAKHGLAAASTTMACFALAVSFTVWTAAACAVQLLLLLAVERYVWKKRPTEVGRVLGKDGKPMRAVVRLFETTYNKLVDTAVTDNSGRFAFLVGANAYYAVAEAPGLEPVRTQVFDFSSAKGEQAIAPEIKLG